MMREGREEVKRIMGSLVIGDAIEIGAARFRVEEDISSGAFLLPLIHLHLFQHLKLYFSDLIPR